MTHLARTIALTGVLAMMGGAAFAQDTDPSMMTCADFMALTADQQVAALEAMKSSGDHGGGMGADASAGAAMESSATGGGTMDATTDSPEGADASGTDMTKTHGAADATAMTGASDTAATSSATGTGAAATGDMATMDADAAALLASCQGHENDLVSDRLAVTGSE